MSLATELERIIPRLRRFARASTGDKELADQCVAQAIEQLTANTLRTDPRTSLSDTVKLYRAVEEVLACQAEGTFERQAWRALILVVVEGFSPLEAGWILGIGAERVERMVAAGRDHDNQTSEYHDE